VGQGFDRAAYFLFSLGFGEWLLHHRFRFRSVKTASISGRCCVFPGGRGLRYPPKPQDIIVIGDGFGAHWLTCSVTSRLPFLLCRSFGASVRMTCIGSNPGGPLARSSYFAEGSPAKQNSPFSPVTQAASLFCLPLF